MLSLGREYTPEITERQRGFAQVVVDAGADYIVGAHSHCIQPYEVLKSADGRDVPCLWSAGNFISDINLKPPITRDTLILDLRLERDAEGRVVLASETYHPCRIMNMRSGPEQRNYAVVPASANLRSNELKVALRDARERITRVVGPGIRPSDDAAE
ncbi:CapA family protein [Microbacterium sp. NIBRBAC000506063]|nr:CapA family protein [Microbacterium sp. NIBRBAC000506063]QTV80572.1 CapA family protein [Microbacterium sp. NIBRBAC000506063]